MLQNLLSAAVVIGALRVNVTHISLASFLWDRGKQCRPPIIGAVDAVNQMRVAMGNSLPPG